MRRLAVVVLPLAVLALVLAGVALAGNAGFGPLPAHSPNASRIGDAYWLIFGFTSAIFLIVEGTLVAFAFKYRGRGRARTEEGLQVHGNTRLETIWTVIPVVILAAIAGFVFYKLPGIANVPAAAAGNRVDVRVDAHQYYWQFTYPDGTVSIEQLHMPVGKVIDFDIHTRDVIHSFWVPELGGKTDAVSGRVNHTWFQPQKLGTFYGNCAELCGLFHAKMPITAVAESDSDYTAFLARQKNPMVLGKNEFTGVCETCHGLGGKGGYGPAIAANPLLKSFASLNDLVRHGRTGPQGTMPAVGYGWTDAQMKALITYTKTLGGAGGG